MRYQIAKQQETLAKLTLGHMQGWGLVEKALRGACGQFGRGERALSHISLLTDNPLPERPQGLSLAGSFYKTPVFSPKFKEL